MEVSDFIHFKKSLEHAKHYVYALCEVNENERKPFYIGKGVSSRCLQHLNEALKVEEDASSEKLSKINQLLTQDKLGIDILRHGIENEKTAKLIESTCIDLLGIGDLSNKVKGSDSSMGRITLEEFHCLHANEQVEVHHSHSGLAFLLNSTYKSAMTELELFEATRGVWHNVPRGEEIKYAYATYGGLVKEVYEIHGWARAGTQQYFTRNISDESKRWEFIGKKAPDDVRKKYIGKVIQKGGRSKFCVSLNSKFLIRYPICLQNGLQIVTMLASNFGLALSTF